MGSASLKLGASFFVSVVILVLVGSWVLYTYESPAEIRRCEKAERAFDSAAILGVDLTEELQEQTKMSDLTIMTNELFEEIKRQAQDVHQPLCENNWDYPNALFNTGTIIASLGFFHTAPQTFEGKLIVSSLVLFGTPLYFLSIGLIANAIAKAQLKKIVNTGTPLKIGGFTFGILVILALVTCVPASIIQLLEKIEFFDAWYFCVTTITTVGFGDIRLSGPAVAVWLLWIWIGHILMAGILVSLVSAIIISDYKTQQMRDPEEQKLLTQTDGPAAYGGMTYHPTLVPVGTLSPPPPGYDPSDYRALSTIQVREVRKEPLPNDSDPQIDLGSSRSSLAGETSVSVSRSSIQSLNDNEASATTSSPVKKGENTSEHE